LTEVCRLCTKIIGQWRVKWSAANLFPIFIWTLTKVEIVQTFRIALPTELQDQAWAYCGHEQSYFFCFFVFMHFSHYSVDDKHTMPEFVHFAWNKTEHFPEPKYSQTSIIYPQLWGLKWMVGIIKSPDHSNLWTLISQE